MARGADTPLARLQDHTTPSFPTMSMTRAMQVYTVPLGNTEYYTHDFQWKAQDKEQITQVQVTTKDGKPTTKTVTAPVAVMTGPDGDLNVLMAPKLQEKLADMMQNVPACGKKRAEACGIERFLMEFDADDTKLIQSLKDAVEGIKFLSEDVLKALITSAGKKEILLLADGVGAIGCVWMGAHLFLQNQHLPLAFAIKDPPKNDIPKTEPPEEEDSDKCPKDAPKGKDAPLCPDCSGKDNTCQDVCLLSSHLSTGILTENTGKIQKLRLPRCSEPSLLHL